MAVAFDLLLLITGFYLLIKGHLFWLPIAYILFIAIEYFWKFVLSILIRIAFLIAALYFLL